MSTLRWTMGLALVGLLAFASSAQNGNQTGPPASYRGLPTSKPAPPPPQPLEKAVRLRSSWSRSAEGHLRLDLVASGTPGAEFVVLATQPASDSGRIVSVGRVPSEGEWVATKLFPVQYSSALVGIELSAHETTTL